MIGPPPAFSEFQTVSTIRLSNLSSQVETMRPSGLLLPMLGFLLVVSITPTITAAEPGSLADKPATGLSFQREIRPILSEYCFACHGPDAKQRKGDLRLDTAEGIQAGSVVAGKPQESELLSRLVHDDPTLVMPPAKFGKKPTSAQIAKIRTWIAEGAKIESHWAFQSVKRPEVPQNGHATWNKHPIDRFLYEKMTKAGLTPSPIAPQAVLARRLALDLLGLPAKVSEVRALESKKLGLNEYTETLFQSPHYGERMALDWLDAARFADTHGYHLDTARDMTKWREWVIRSFQNDLPFDQFTVEQIAGDLLPNATVEQKIASGFNRNHMITFEGGAIPDEYLTNYIIDRVNTTSTVWLGMSFACAQCHDHKYDPVSMRDYYGLYAFFNRLPESGIGAVGNSAPLLELPDPAQKLRLDQLDEKLRAAQEALRKETEAASGALEPWLKAMAKRNRPIWSAPAQLTAGSKSGSSLSSEKDGAIAVTGANPATDVHELTWKSSESFAGGMIEYLPGGENKRIGRSSNGNMVLTSIKVEELDENNRPTDLPLSRIAATFSQPDYAAGDLLKAGNKGWGIFPQVNKPQRLIFALMEPLPAGKETRLRLTLAYESPYGAHSPARLRFQTTDLPSAADLLDFPKALESRADWAQTKNAAEKQKISDWFVNHRPGVAAKIRASLEALKKERADTAKSFPTAMVMQDMAKPRDTFVLLRGAYDKKGDKVDAHTPSFLPPLPAGAPSNRLGLAQWLVSKDHPLVARVYVNRVWQTLFGYGLVRTSEDFGSQGEQPTHPELLDWLAAEFMNPTHPAMEGKAWSVRGLVRLIVTSEAYRQSSIVDPAALAKDPENRLLARASRLRLPAELIRDQALAASGLLDERIGGASVNPYQPSGLWEELMSREDSANFTAQFFVQSKGNDLYRRSLYTFWKRTSPPPALATFDAPDRETCTIRRSRTNTPLQALVLLNDPTYVEASRKMAELALKEKGDAESRVEFLFRRVLARSPSLAEKEVLGRVLKRQLNHFQSHPEAAQALLKVGESPSEKAAAPAELAAWAILCNVIFNLDESVNRS